MKIKNILGISLILISLSYRSQNQEIKLDATKIKTYLPYLQAKLGLNTPAFSVWKENNKALYAKEMWYYTESFYLKKDHNLSGESLNIGFFDVSRFEHLRNATTEVIIPFEGFKDAVVLLPKTKLLYNPSNN